MVAFILCLAISAILYFESAFRQPSKYENYRQAVQPFVDALVKLHSEEYSASYDDFVRDLALADVESDKLSRAVNKENYGFNSGKTFSDALGDFHSAAIWWNLRLDAPTGELLKEDGDKELNYKERASIELESGKSFLESGE